MFIGYCAGAGAGAGASSSAPGTTGSTTCGACSGAGASGATAPSGFTAGGTFGSTGAIGSSVSVMTGFWSSIGAGAGASSSVVVSTTSVSVVSVPSVSLTLSPNTSHASRARIGTRMSGSSHHSLLAIPLFFFGSTAVEPCALVGTCLLYTSPSPRD